MIGWIVLVALLSLLGGVVAALRRTMPRADWWAMVVFSLLLGGTMAWMLWAGLGKPTMMP